PLADMEASFPKRGRGRPRLAEKHDYTSARADCQQKSRAVAVADGRPSLTARLTLPSPLGRGGNYEETAVPPDDVRHQYLHRISHRRIDPPAVTAATGVSRLIEEAFLSYNARRLREACRLYATKMLADDAVVGLSLSGALTPAGLGASCLVPLIEAGFVDWIVSTGANLYHDTHFALGMDMHQSRPGLNDLELRE